MLGNEWLFETPFGEEVRLRLGSGEEEPPTGRALWEVECVIERLLSNLHDPWRRRGLDHLFEALTGRAPQGLLPGDFPGETIYSPFEPSGDLYERDLNRTFRAAAASGQLRVELIERPRVSVRQDLPAPLGPTAPAPTPTEPTTTWFEVRFVDEVGDPIDGLEVMVRAGGREEKLTTDGDGVARLEGADSSFASVRVVSRKALSDIVEPRFAEGRAPRFPALPFTKFPFGGELPTVSLESEEQKLIVVTPKLGKLFVELWDKTGSELHPHTEYTISGPMSFEGVTDEQGRLVHEDVAPGEYELTLKVDVNRTLKPAAGGDGTDEAGGGGGGAGAGDIGAGGGGAGADSDYEPEIEEYQTTLVVVDPTVGEPQLRFVGVVPRVHLARMRGMLFDTNKTFVLPTALPSLQKVRTLYEQLNPAELLIVGHTDTTSEPSVNDPLSKKRADAMAQYLTDDVDGWLANFESSVPQKERWGAREDRLMMLKLPGYDARPAEKPPIEWYQEQHNAAVDAGAKEGRSTLTVDGKSGPKTRRELITDYMALDGATLSDDAEFHISVQTHGCGENFPLDESLATTDERPEAERDGERDRHDRRVELFFFDHEFAVRPAATAADGAEYLTWRKLAAKHEHDFAVEGVNNKATVLPLTHAHFRTGSAVLLPEGETPVSGVAAGTAASTSSVCALAMALRFNEERPGHTMLIAGHTDSVGGEAGNQKLSEQRAELVHAVLMGKRDEFAKIAQATHKVGDYKQILKWASVTLSGLEPPEGGVSQSGAESPGGAGGPQPAASPGGAELPAHDFAACDPGVIDDVAFTGIEPLKAFQRAYNANKPALGASAADLAVDGAIGPKTWGAIFDCYQFNMAQELGEVDDEADESNPTKLIEGLDKLRGMVTFLALDEEFIGLGEAHPADGNRRDGAASQENRRVELLFFESGQEPDVAILKEAPEITELYSPDAFVREELRLPNARRGALYIGLRSRTRFSPNCDFPKPSLLPALRKIGQRTTIEPELQCLFIGHSDDIGVDASPTELSVARVESVKAWLSGDAQFFLKRFEEGGPGRTWSWEELQWMLLAQPFDEFPFYVGRVDGYPGISTFRALEFFQWSHDLPVTGLADQQTLEKLVASYIELGQNIMDVSRINMVGGADACPPEPLEEEASYSDFDDEPQRMRRVEAILHRGPMKPAVPEGTLSKTRYRTLWNRVGEMLEDEEPRVFPVAIVDPQRAPRGGARVTVFQVDEHDNKLPVASGVAREDGLVSFALNEGRFVIEGDGARGVLTVDYDRVGGQVLVMVDAEES